MQTICKWDSVLVMQRCLSFLSLTCLHEPNPAPNTRGARTINSASPCFYLRGKDSPGKRNTSLVECSPQLIRLPQVADPATGQGMQFAAGLQKLLQRIVLGRSRNGSFVERGWSLGCMGLVSVWLWNLFKTAFRSCLDLRACPLLEKLSGECSRGHCLWVSLS
jgi:hypothetical protein